MLGLFIAENVVIGWLGLVTKSFVKLCVPRKSRVDVKMMIFLILGPQCFNLRPQFTKCHINDIIKIK